MRGLLLIAGTLSFLGACSSGAGCGGAEKREAPAAGETSSFPGGAASHGGLNEAVSFQGLGRKPAADPPRSTPCGGFPNLAADCKNDPVFEQLRKKCCPAGTVDQCQAIPGGALLIGHGCASAQ